MQIDFKEINKSQWKCFQFADRSVYFGQTTYLDQKGVLVNPKQQPQITSNDKAKLIRHGLGIQIYQNQPLFNYKGYWKNDLRNGLGRCWFPDGMYYQGNFKDDYKSQYGKCIFKNGSRYQGNWKLSRFEGAGSFIHQNVIYFNQGQEYKGIFKNNSFIEGDQVLNPFFTWEENNSMRTKGRDKHRLIQKQNKLKYFSFTRCKTIQEVIASIYLSNQNNRVALIVSELNHKIRIQDLIQMFEKNDKKTYNFDLRKMQVLKQQQQFAQKKHQIKTSLINLMKTNGILVINLDDSDVNFQNVFYPDIRQFYDGSFFPSEIWSNTQLHRRQVYQRIMGEQQQMKQIGVCVWSKYQVSGPMQSKRIIQKLQNRFSSVIPIIKIDFILFQGQ